MGEHRCSGCLQTEYEETRKLTLAAMEPHRKGIVESPEKLEWHWDLETILLLPLIAVVFIAAGIVVAAMLGWSAVMRLTEPRK